MAAPSMDVPNVTAPGDKKKKKLPKIVIVVPVFLALLAVFFLVGPGKAMIGKDAKKKEAVKKEATHEMPHAAVEIGEFVLNLRTPQGGEPRYVKVGIAIGIEGEGGGHGKSPIEGREPFLKDVIIERFSAASIEELNDSAGRARIKKELETEFASMMPEDIKVNGVYFTQLAFQ